MEPTGARTHLALVRATPAPTVPTGLLPRSLPRTHVDRPRLFDALGSTRGTPLTVVTGPPGAGKTVLVRSWLETLPTGTWAGAEVDRDDARPERFWTTLATATAAAVHGVGSGALELLASGSSARAGQRRLLEEVTAWCADHDLVVVIEDYHLAAAPEIDDQLGWFVEHLPPRSRVVITSRRPPHLGLGRRRVRGELTEVRGPGLAFRIDEARALFARFGDLGIDPATVDALAARTEGWVAGLQLAALALRGSADPSHVVDRFSGSTESVAAFLLEEVLERQEPAVRTFLLSTSVLPTFSAELAAAVTGDLGSARILRDLDAQELFVVPIEGADGWYRYHGLFADLLQRELRIDRPGDEPDLRRRAAAWLAEHDHPADALDHAPASGDEAVALGVLLSRPSGRQSGRSLPGTPERLTDREVDLLRLLPTHLSNKELSVELYVSLNTVKSHLKSLYRKLGVTTRSDAVAVARDAHLIDP